jgi:hypothetical protein
MHGAAHVLHQKIIARALGVGPLLPEAREFEPEAETGVRAIVRPTRDDTREVAASITRVLEDDMDDAILGMDDEESGA